MPGVRRASGRAFRVARAILSQPLAPVPQRLQTQLLVLASRERARWNSTRTLPLALRTWARDARLTIDNLMRPLALPFAGGLLSALVLFSMLVPTFGFRPSVRNDVPHRLVYRGYPGGGRPVHQQR